MALKDELVKKMVSSLNKENIPGSELAKTVNDVTSSVKKFETEESTGSGSAGAFVAPLGSKKETNEKWSEKYKKSIDCNNPKGFSQKAHCQGRKKKVEANEATGSGSSGSYETPAFGAKSMDPDDWRGASKTQIPGGQFVKVKEKCKKFPYCNQGDINALDLSENKFTKKIIEKLSEEYFIDVKTLSNIILKEINKTK